MLTKKAKDVIKKNPMLMGRLAASLGCSVHTIIRWIYANDTIMLTTAQALQIIREETGMSDDEILEKENAA